MCDFCLWFLCHRDLHVSLSCTDEASHLIYTYFLPSVTPMRKWVGSSLPALCQSPWGPCVVVRTIAFADRQANCARSLRLVAGDLRSGHRRGSHSHKQTKHNIHRVNKWGRMIDTCTRANLHLALSRLCSKKEAAQREEERIHIRCFIHLCIYLMYNNVFTFDGWVLELCFGFFSGLFHFLENKSSHE